MTSTSSKPKGISNSSSIDSLWTTFHTSFGSIGSLTLSDLTNPTKPSGSFPENGDGHWV